jgi:hypothetical protein
LKQPLPLLAGKEWDTIPDTTTSKTASPAPIRRRVVLHSRYKNLKNRPCLLAGRKPYAAPVTTTFKAACGCENIFTKFDKILDICKRM